MASFLIKTLSLAGLLSVGGGVGIGTSAWFNHKEDTVEKPKNRAESEKSKDKPAESPKKVCVIYEGNDPGKDKRTRKFSELLEKFESQEQFFERFEKNSERPILQSFKDEIKKACEGTGNKRNVKGNVYVWWGANEKKWFYASDMHDEDDDWINNTEVKKKFQENQVSQQN